MWIPSQKSTQRLSYISIHHELKVWIVCTHLVPQPLRHQQILQVSCFFQDFRINKLLQFFYHNLQSCQGHKFFSHPECYNANIIFNLGILLFSKTVLLIKLYKITCLNTEIYHVRIKRFFFKQDHHKTENFPTAAKKKKKLSKLEPSLKECRRTNSKKIYGQTV